MPQGSFYDNLISGCLCKIFIKRATKSKRFILKKAKANKFIVLNAVIIIVNGEKIKAKVLILATNIKEDYLLPKLEKAKKYKWKRKRKSLKINKKNNFNPNDLYVIFKKGDGNLLVKISDNTVHEIKNIKKHQKLNDNDWKEIVEQNTQKIETKLNNWVIELNISNVEQSQKQLDIFEIVKKLKANKEQLAEMKNQKQLAPNFAEITNSDELESIELYSDLRNNINELKQYFHFQKKFKNQLQIYKQHVIDINNCQLQHYYNLINKSNCIKINSYLNAWKTKIANFDNYIDIGCILTIDNEEIIENKIKKLEKYYQENSYNDLIKYGFDKNIISILQQTKYDLNKIFKTNISSLDIKKWLENKISNVKKDLKKIKKINLPNKPAWYQWCIFKIYDLFFKLKKSKINHQEKQMALLKEQSSIKIKNLESNTYILN